MGFLGGAQGKASLVFPMVSYDSERFPQEVPKTPLAFPVTTYHLPLHTP